MKKIFTSFLVASLIFLNGINATFALTYDESYQAAQSYYLQKTSLSSVDEILAYEALGLESDDLLLDEGMMSTEYASDIAKAVLALALHGDNPNDYKSVNYVQMLEDCVHANGAFDKTNEFTYANYQVYGVYALYVVGSEKTELAADYLASLMNEQGAFGSSYGVSLDITGWCVEALSLVNKTKYQATIEKAIQYISAHQIENAGYKDEDTVWGDVVYPNTINANTQACVLMGLLTYDSQGVKGSVYDKGANNPYDVLLTFQNDNGSFWYYSKGEENFYATVQGAQAIGYYYNGSVYEDAKREYQETIKPAVKNVVLDQTEVKLTEGETVQLTATIAPATANQTVKWSVADTNIAVVNENGLVTGIKEGSTTVYATAENGIVAECKINVEKTVVTPIVNQPDQTVVKNPAPQTGDMSNVFLYSMLMLASSLVVIRGRKSFGKEH